MTLEIPRPPLWGACRSAPFVGPVPEVQGVFAVILNPGAGAGILIARRKVLGGGSHVAQGRGRGSWEVRRPLLLQTGVPRTSVAPCASSVKERTGADALL